MDLQEIWNLPEKDSVETTPEKIRQGIHAKSKSIMETLRTSLRNKLYFAVAFTILYGTLGLYSADPILMTMFGVVAGLNLLLVLYIYWQYKRIQPVLPSEYTALDQMKQVYHSVRKALRAERYGAMSYFPALLVAAMLFGGSLVGKQVSELLQSTHFLLEVLVFLMVLTPLVHWLGKKMTHLAFGQYLEKLDHNIKRLEQQEQ